MDFLKTMAGKVVSGLVALLVVVLVITFWQMDPATRRSIFGGTGKIFGWFMAVLLIPWATFFLIGKVGRMGSNLAGGLLVFGYTALEMLWLGYLFEWQVRGAAGWTFLALGALVAGVYNLFACDWIAEKVA